MLYRHSLIQSCCVPVSRVFAFSQRGVPFGEVLSVIIQRAESGHPLLVVHQWLFSLIWLCSPWKLGHICHCGFFFPWAFGNAQSTGAGQTASYEFSRHWKGLYLDSLPDRGIYELLLGTASLSSLSLSLSPPPPPPTQTLIWWQLYSSSCARHVRGTAWLVPHNSYQLVVIVTNPILQSRKQRLIVNNKFISFW